MAEPPGSGVWLGIQLVPVDGESGVQSVRALRMGGPAHKAGLALDDKVLMINGNEANLTRLDSVLSGATPGDVVQFLVLRGDKRLTFSAIVEPMPAKPTPPPKIRPRKGWFGIGLQGASLEEQKRIGVELPVPKVTKVFRGSPAEMSGIQIGEFVIALNGDPIVSVADLVGKVGRQAPGAEVDVTCHNGTRRITRKAVLDLRPDMRQLFVAEWRGRTMPSVDLRQVGGSTTRLSLDKKTIAGKVLLVDYFATWCGPCKRVMPELSALQDTYQKDGLQVVGVSGEELKTVSDYNKKYAPAYPLAVDDTGAFRKQLNVSVLPTLWVVDRNGVIRDIWFGAGHMDAIRARIKQLLEDSNE